MIFWRFHAFLEIVSFRVFKNAWFCRYFIKSNKISFIAFWILMKWYFMHFVQIRLFFVLFLSIMIVFWPEIAILASFFRFSASVSLVIGKYPKWNFHELFYTYRWSSGRDLRKIGVSKAINIRGRKLEAAQRPRKIQDSGKMNKITFLALFLTRTAALEFLWYLLR